MKEEKYFNVVKKNSQKAEIYMYGYIFSEQIRDEGETSAISFKKELDQLGDVKQIDLRINSGGGDVFEAVAIYNMLKRHKATVHSYIDGLAASAASMIAMVGDKVFIPENALIMIHNAWSTASGDYREFEKSAQTLKQINETLKTAYVDKGLHISKEELSRMMDEETWLDSRKAIGLGFADEVIQPINAAASLDRNILGQYQNVPKNLEEKLSVKPQNKQQNKKGNLADLLLKL